MDNLTICVTSDTHGAKPALPFANVLVHAGDWSEYGTRDESMRAADWLAAQPHEHKLVTCGNHDKAMLEPEIVAEFERRGIKVLIDKSIMITGYRWFGYPWTVKVGDWAFDGREDFLKSKALTIPHADVLVSHGPAFGTLDADGERRMGCHALAEARLRTKPTLHLFGHIHEGYGHSYSYETGIYSVNAAHMDYSYSPKNRPYLLNVSGKEVQVLQGGRA